MRIKNLLIKALFFLYKSLSVPNPISEKKRFLIVSTTGLGDTLWATPAIKALRETFPTSYIGVLTSSIGKEVLKHNPHIDELFLLKNSSLISIVLLYKRLRKKNISTVLLFHASQRLIPPLCRFIGPSEMIATLGQNKGLDFLLTKGLENSIQHEIARRLQIVHAAGAQGTDLKLEFFLSEEDERQVDHFLQECPTPHLPLVGIHPGAKDRFKHWDADSFIQMAKRLKKKKDCQIFITGTREERDLMGRISGEVPGSLLIPESFSLGALAALIQKMTVFISNDTGPMHVAFAMQTPTIALFAPTDPFVCGPFFPTPATVIAKRPTCAPCLRKKCKDPFCMFQISVDEVYQAALNFLTEKRHETLLQK